jgi:hypothetical protein
VAQEIRAVRNPITGEWHGGRARLEALGLPYIVLKDWAKPQRQTILAVPQKLHTQQSEGHLGGLFHTSAMRKYMHAEKDKPAPSLSYAERHWWAGEDAERELRASFPPALVDIVLSVRRDGRAWDEALKGTNFSFRDVKTVMRRMAHARRKTIREAYPAA